MNQVDYEWEAYQAEQRAKGLVSTMIFGLILTVIWAIIIFAFVGCAQAMHTKGMEMTKDFEGFSSSIYVCPGGAKTIGYGFNLSDSTVAYLIPKDVRSGDRPITTDEAEEIFQKLYQRAVEDVEIVIGGSVLLSLSDEQQFILFDMAYQMGRASFSTFIEFRKALVNGDIEKAVEEMKDSKWYKESGQRSKHHVEVFNEYSK